MKIGFALITEQPFLEKIVSLENQLHEECHFSDCLGLVHNLPHTTLFQGDMDEGIDYQMIAEQIARKVEEVLAGHEMRFQEVVYVPEGWYFWECEKSEGLTALHDFTLKAVEPYIILDPKRMDRNPDALSEFQREGIRRYGYRYAGKAFYPHITLGRTSARSEETIQILRGAFEALDGDTFTERVTVYKMGNNGTHKDTLYQVSLQS